MVTIEATPAAVHTVHAPYQLSHRAIDSTYPCSLKLRPLKELGLDQLCGLTTWLMAFRMLSEDFYTGGDRNVDHGGMRHSLLERQHTSRNGCLGRVLDPLLHCPKLTILLGRA